jgi:hypothetical protein
MAEHVFYLYTTYLGEELWKGMLNRLHAYECPRAFFRVQSIR